MTSAEHPRSRNALLSVLVLAVCASALAGCADGPPGAPGGVSASPTSPSPSPQSPSSSPSGGSLFILDDDWSLNSGGNALVLLATPGATMLGTTTTTGDAWAPQGTAAALSFFEKIRKPDVPVAQGQIYPLINTPARTYARAKLYGGGSAWQGAFNASKDHPDTPAIPDPEHVTEPLTGWATSLKPAPQDAAAFLIGQVHAHPGQVTIVATGPLTNVAAAIRRDPTFAAAAKAIVIGGGNLYQLDPGETDRKFNSSEGFNFRFDPESAHIALTAAWPSITVVGDATSTVLFDEKMMARVTSVDTPASEFVKKVGYVGYPIWDETTALVAAHPNLVTHSIPLRMDVDISGGPQYGSTRVWADGDSPGLGEDLVTYVQAVDPTGVADLFVDATHATWS